MGGRDQSERLVAINRNQWPQSAGARTHRQHCATFVLTAVTSGVNFTRIKIRGYLRALRCGILDACVLVVDFVGVE